MKTRFSTIDIFATLSELNNSIKGFRVINVYDIDSKTYLFKLSGKEVKAILLVESGSRFHTTEFSWPKNPAPSSFSMKLRKHIQNKRLESITQLGIDRIIDLQFGSNIAAYHVIVELYDRGNIVLADYEYTILNILRARTEGEDVRFAVREKYPLQNAKGEEPSFTEERLKELFATAKDGDNLRKILNPHLLFGPAVIDHVLAKAQFKNNVSIGKEFNPSTDIDRLLNAFKEAENIFHNAKNGVDVKGFIVQKKESRSTKTPDGKQEDYLVYNEFHPYLFKQHENLPLLEFDSFNKAVDEFFSKIESQKIDVKAIQKEREALKKLENVKKDHEQRLMTLQKVQEEDMRKGQLIELNLELVDKAILIIQSALANQLDWKEIGNLVQEAKAQGNPVALAIKSLKLDTNHICLKLSDPYAYISEDEAEIEVVEEVKGKKKKKQNANSNFLFIDIDLDLTAYANAKKYFDLKRNAAKKEQKTLESSTKAYKSAEKKTKQTLKDVATITSINKIQKTYWFEKFFWFISSENYLVISGRDQQQNELVVKRYFRNGDLYVHADLHGASSIIIKNPSGNPVPPKTLNEAGTMAVCYSSAWNAKIVTSAWWVYHHQVSKTAPSGEYLTTGSFMIRGKKNYLPPCYLIMGFGFMFKLDDESLANHADDRKVTIEEEDTQSSTNETIEDDIELQLSDNDNSDDEKSNASVPLTSVEIKEESNENNENQNSDEKGNGSDSDSEEESQFPDTTIAVELIQGDKFRVRASNSITKTEDSDVVYLGDDIPVVLKPKQAQAKSQSKKPTKSVQNLDSEDKNVKKSNPETVINKPQKKLSKFKQKKMEKYKDQDEEDRILALQILRGTGETKIKKKKKGKQNEKEFSSKQNWLKQNGGKQIIKPGNKQNVQNVTLSTNTGDTNEISVPVENPAEIDKDVNEQQASDDEKDEKQQADEEKILNSLTGIPLSNDVLLFAVPVCAPYSCMMNYKFKVKLTPGNGKRGKATKTALAMFQNDKATSQREKDLLKSVKDQDLARNLPGKVKVSAPHLQKHKR